MAKYYVSTTNNPIIFHLKRCKIGKTALCRILETTEPTLNVWIDNPLKMPLCKIISMAGLFGVPCEEFVYILLRNKPQLNKDGKWYLEEIRSRVDSPL